MMKTLLILALLALAAPLMAADPTPEELREAGLAALKAAQADPDQIVLAARLLSQAADAFAKAGKDADAQELESYLFWAKKKMTIQQIDKFLGTGNGVAKAAVAKMEQIEKKEVKVEESVAWLAKADDYAAKAKDQFLVAVRYFEVASRFKGTPEGEMALDKSLKALQQAKVDSKAVSGKAEKGDGKIYVQSKPAGAQILVVQGGELRDTGLKTPSLVQLPVGKAELLLRMAKFDEAKLNTDVTTSISKPEAVVMEPEKFDLEVTAEAGLGDAWDVYVDGKPATDKAGKPAVAPCTIRVAEGMRSIQLAKNGFVDPQAVRAAIKAGENAPVTVKGQAVKGNSVLTGEWVVLFRSDDPQCWDTNSVAPKYAILLASAPDTIRFLRIKRLDTDEEVVVPITKKSLSDPANRKSRYGWIGSNQNVWGGYHLGIFDTRLVNKVGDIGVTPDAPTLSGWGFGHKAGAAGQTYCVWAGKEIKKTVFEISVTSLAVDPSKLLK